MKRGFLFVLFFLFLANSVFAILITPASLEMEFAPNKEYDCSFIVRVNKQTDLLVYARGELNQSVSFSKNKLKAVPGEWNSVGCKIKMPQDMKPGLNKNFVGVVEDTSGKGVVGGVTGVEVTLFIRKPYPGKYLELEKFEANNAEINEKVNFLIEVINRGKEKINNAFALIEVYDKDKKIDQVESNHIEIVSNGVFKAEWKTSVAGRYKALARINYDGSILEEKKNFNVGERLAKILNISDAKVKKGDIAKFDINIQSYWNEIIKDVYLELKVVGQEVNSRTESISLGPWDSRTITGFLETSSLEEGEYEVDVTLNYDDKYSEAKTSLVVTKGFSLSVTTIVLIVIIAILILLVIINIVMFKKKWKKRK